jgi:hypothetical protein
MVTRLVLGLMNLFLLVGEAFLALRVVLRLFAADPTQSFVHWVYASSSVMMEPFRNVFSPGMMEKKHVVDFAAMFAMMVYVLVVMLFIKLATKWDPERLWRLDLVKR